MKRDKATETQPHPNISTEHQKDGDARRPRDVLDRDDAKRDPQSGAPIPTDYDPKAQQRNGSS
jgi:hypothetical protein